MLKVSTYMKQPQRIVIVGGGTAGWMTAAALSQTLGPAVESITLIESSEIGTVGVGEATIPHLRYFNEKLGINEHEFIKRTNATYKLGIEFSNWGANGDSYIHPFGDFGTKKNGIPFHHYWLKAQQSGQVPPIFDFSLPAVAAKLNRFDYPQNNKRSLLSSYAYAFHIDASLYASYLKELFSGNIRHIEAKIVQVNKDYNTGDISNLHLENGVIVEGDFFIDCSGFKALLIEETLGSEFEDWSRWLPCDSALAAPSAQTSEPPPYTKAIAQEAGWSWHIPLQHRMGNGYVYCSKYITDEQALETLTNSIEGPLLCPPKKLNFKAGRRIEAWKNNCIAIGLSSGFLEPLESTSIYLIQSSIMKLVELFSHPPFVSASRVEFNRQNAIEYERIKDFLILHYHATKREDSEFWRYCKNMDIPTSLKEKMNAFKSSGYIAHYDQGLFLTPSWAAVYLGQQVIPEEYHPNADLTSDTDLAAALSALRQQTRLAAESLPLHKEAIKQHTSESRSWPSASMSLYEVFS